MEKAAAHDLISLLSRVTYIYFLELRICQSRDTHTHETYPDRSCVERYLLEDASPLPLSG